MDLYKDKTADLHARVNDLMSKMTLDEKIGQLTQDSIGALSMDSAFEKARNGNIGSLIFSLTAFAGEADAEEIAINRANQLQKAAVEESRLGIPIINGQDVIHGFRTIFPTPLAQAASWDKKMIEKASEIMAKEASYTGVHWTFAPMVDLARDPRWSRISESYGEDPCLGGELAAASIHGIQGKDMSRKDRLVACAKHFIGYGAAEGGRDYCKAEISEYTLRNFYLPAFKCASEAGVGTVMNSFNEISGEPVASSRYLLRDVLKNELGFDGFVISDWGSIEQLENFGVASNREDCAALAFHAGIDMDMVDGCYNDHLKSLVEAKKVPLEYIDDSVRRILTIKFKAGLFEHPYIETVNLDEVMLLPEYVEFAEEFAANCAVLLKNENNILPLNKGRTLALCGNMLDSKRDLLSSWIACGRENDTQSFLEALQEYNGPENCLISRDVHGKYNQSIFKSADAVIVAIGEPWMTTGEANSVASIDVNDERLEYVKQAKLSGKKVITVLFAAKPLAFPEIAAYSDAILYAWQSGTRTAAATVKLIFGDYIPCGKLPATLPMHTGQIPIYYNFNENPRFIDDYYDNKDKFKIGARTLVSYHDISGAPLYPFGFGLSYTDFKYGKPSANAKELKLEELQRGKSFKIRTSITNTGKYNAYEIAQCYIADTKASMCRPTRELRGFQKLFINAGETKEVEFDLDFNKLGFYGRNNKFIVEKGEFEIYVGPNCLTDNKLIVQVI